MHTPGAIERMAIEVETKDCTALSDAELAEMADICADGPAPVRGRAAVQAGRGVGARSPWPATVGSLKGFSFCTLERIGGTPSVLIGLASIKRTSKRDTVLRAMMTDQFRRAVLAFPDEDVLVGTRFTNAGGLRGVQGARRHRPPPRPQGHRRGAGLGPAPGQALRHRERRLRRPHLRGHGRRRRSRWPSTTRASSPRTSTPRSSALFDDVDAARGDSLIAFGWAMAEQLAKLS